MSERQETAGMRHWAGKLEAVRDLDQDGYRVVVWDACSENADGGPVAAGVVQLPPGAIGLEELAFGLRGLLQQAVGDPSISVTVVDQADEGVRGVAEFHQRNPYTEDPEEYEYEDEYAGAGQDAEDGPGEAYYAYCPHGAAPGTCEDCRMVRGHDSMFADPAGEA